VFSLPSLFSLIFCALAAPSGGAAAAEGQDALNAPDMDCSSFGFNRARSRPAKTIRGKNNAAYYPDMRYSQQSLARRLA
jgi:hypothetical protein